MAEKIILFLSILNATAAPASYTYKGNREAETVTGTQTNEASVPRRAPKKSRGKPKTVVPLSRAPGIISLRTSTGLGRKTRCPSSAPPSPTKRKNP